MTLQNYITKTNTERLDQFMVTLSRTNRTPQYYVNWEKVKRNTKEFELELNTLNYLLGKKDIKSEARALFTSQLNLLKAIPSLIASRDKKIDILIIDQEDLKITELDFIEPDLTKLDDYLEFMEDSGLFEFMQNNISNNLVDYVYGVETGLDSNARKNRSGTTMEDIINHYVLELIDDKGDYESITQASGAIIKNTWNVNVPMDKSKRIFDEAVYDKRNNHVYLIETNYYGGGGSKLKAVSGEFSELNQFLKNNKNLTFIWITDGQGWHTARIPLSEAFDKIDYIFNLDMLRQGYLKELILGRKF